MSPFQFIIGGILPYVALAVLIAGLAYRFRLWYTAPQPGKITLTPAPKGSLPGAVLTETIFFQSLFKGNKGLWLFSWAFHVALAFIILGHVRVFTSAIDRMLGALGVANGGMDLLSSVLGGIAGIVILVACILLLSRRLALARVREISGPGDYFALLLMAGIIITGNVMRFGPEHFDLGQTRSWAYSLITFSPAPPESGIFLFHALLAQVLLICLPFSKVLHFGGIFFTQALIKRS